MVKAYVIKGWTKEGQVRYVPTGFTRAVVPHPAEAMGFDNFEGAFLHMVNTCLEGCYSVEEVFYLEPKSEPKKEAEKEEEKVEKDVEETP